MSLSVWPASARFTTVSTGITTRHSFSFGSAYDPANVGFGALVAFNDELLPEDTGYPDHPHADLEIVTVVLSGALRHTSSVGSGLLGPGDVQVLSAGSGVVHSEVSASSEPTRFLQTWVRPSVSGLQPSYESAADALGNGLVRVAGGSGLPVAAAGSSLWLGRLGAPVALPDAPRLHVFVAAGSGTIGDRLLSTDDAARVVDQGGRTFTPTSPDTVLAVWAMP